MTTASSPDKTSPKPSSFVTAIAWIFIALAGFSTLIAVLQNIMLLFFFPAEEMQTAMDEAQKGPPIPEPAKFMMKYGHLFFVAFLIVSLATLVSAIGLLKRKNWARLMFIGIMVFAIVWNLGGMFVPFLMFSSFPSVPDHAPADFREQFETITKVMAIVGVVIAVAFSVLFGWIIKRLVSQDIKREFFEV